MFAISADCTLFYLRVVPGTSRRYRCMCVCYRSVAHRPQPIQTARACVAHTNEHASLLSRA